MHQAYKRVDVETAPQGKLIVMLLNGAMQRAEEAKRFMANGEFAATHNKLLRAQDILCELRGALDMSAGEVAQNLDRVYEYLTHLLVRANLEKASAPIDECLEHLIGMRDTWDEVFKQQSPARNAPQLDPHGAAVMNLRG